MRSNKTFFLLCGLFVIGLGPALQAQEAKIIRVEREARPTSTSRTPNYFGIPSLPQFRGYRQTADAEIYYVHWQPLGQALARPELLFDYKQAKVAGTRTLRIAYPFDVTDRRRATFRLSQRARAEGGPIAGWRVRLNSGGRLVAQSSGGNWGKK